VTPRCAFILKIDHDDDGFRRVYTAEGKTRVVLQGAGARLLSAGATRALCHQDFMPEWVAGISIGAINAAIIVGTRRKAGREAQGILADGVVAACRGAPWWKGDRARSLFNETSAALIATFGVPGFFTPRFPPAPLWPQGSPQSPELLRHHAAARDGWSGWSISTASTPARPGSASAPSAVTNGQLQIFRQFRIQEALARESAPNTHGVRGVAAGLSIRRHQDEHFWDGGIASNTPLDYVLDEDNTDDLLIFQGRPVQRARPLPRRCWRPRSAKRTSAFPAAPG